jgi:hypothetical protein
VHNNTVVSYTVRPEAYAEHVRLIERVFAQLREECPGNVDYQVLCLADGVSFVHVSNHETADGSSPLPALSTFKECLARSGVAANDDELAPGHPARLVRGRRFHGTGGSAIRRAMNSPAAANRSMST